MPGPTYDPVPIDFFFNPVRAVWLPHWRTFK
jgi:hypothetical protein